MDEKNVSILIFVFVLLVAIPGMVFVFSNAVSITGEPQYAPAYNPMPYSTGGVEVPLFDANRNFIGYETRGHTAIGRAYEPSFYETYSSQMNMECPPGYLSLTQRQAADYLKLGRPVEKFGFNYCMRSASH